LVFSFACKTEAVWIRESRISFGQELATKSFGEELPANAEDQVPITGGKERTQDF